MEELAPLRYAEQWDNVGLLLGGEGWPAGRIMLTIDLTRASLDEAIDRAVQCIIAYHPPIFDSLKSITMQTARQEVILRAATSGIAIYTPHTALDAAPEGVNDWLAAGMGAGDVKALRAYEDLPRTEARKVITFCPEDHVDRVRNAMASVGAGQIGEYSQCSFNIPGFGTFFGEEAANPIVGEAGRLERVNEIRLEMVCPVEALALAVTAIRQFHPYEEPPIEIYSLNPRPERTVGQGRRVVLDRRVSLTDLVERVKKTLGIKHVKVARGENAPSTFSSIGLCAGAGGSLVSAAIEAGCEVFFTGEMRHHTVMDAVSRGCTVLLAGHTNTERGYLRLLRKRLGAELDRDDVEILVSKRDRPPFAVK